MDAWILGGTGRTGRAIVASLAGTELTPVPVGRDATRLAAVFPDLAHTVVVDSVDAMSTEVRRQQPRVVVNTVGPFARTAAAVARAGLPTTHYLDLANDVLTFEALAALHDDAVAAGRSVVPGAGFGVVATEGVVVALCAGRATPARVRVDAVPSLATEEGVVGEALAATIVDGLPEGGRRYVDGRLQWAGTGSDARPLVLPDGSTVTTGAVPSGDLVAAQRASGAPAVVAGSSMVPTARVLRALLPVAGAVLSIAPLRDLARRRLASVRTRAGERPREHSYGHAHVEWADGTVQEGWLLAGDAGEFTAAVAAAVALGLAAGRGRPGVHSPVAALGPGIVSAAGGGLLLDATAEG